MNRLIRVLHQAAKIICVWQRVALCILCVLIWQPVRAAEQDEWQDKSDGAGPSKVVQLLKIYGVVPTRISAKYFAGFRDTIGAVTLLRASKDLDCVQQRSCWYVLLSNNSPDAPIVTTCELQDGSLAHHFHNDKSNFFVFEFSCSGAPMQIQVSNGHFFVIAAPKP